MSHYERFTKAETRLIVELRDAGLTLDYIVRRLQEAGFGARTRRSVQARLEYMRRTHAVSDRRAVRIKQLRDEGWASEEAARILGISVTRFRADVRCLLQAGKLPRVFGVNQGKCARDRATGSPAPGVAARLKQAPPCEPGHTLGYTDHLVQSWLSSIATPRYYTPATRILTQSAAGSCADATL